MKCPLNLPELRITTPFTNNEETLRNRIESSEIFVIYCNKKYYYELLNKIGTISKQIEIVKELRKPTILLLDKKLSMDKIINMRTIPNLNIVKEVIYDFSNKNEKLRIEKEITEYCKESK